VVRGAKLDTGLVTQLAGPVPLSINVSSSTELQVDASQVELSLSGNVWMKLLNAIKPLLISTVIEMLPSIAKDVRHAPTPLPSSGLAPYATTLNLVACAASLGRVCYDRRRNNRPQRPPARSTGAGSADARER
jgi:hypothetical protein